MREDGLLSEVIEIFFKYGFKKWNNSSFCLVKEFETLNRAIVIHANPSNYDECVINLSEFEKLDPFRKRIKIFKKLFVGYLYSVDDADNFLKTITIKTLTQTA